MMDLGITNIINIANIAIEVGTLNMLITYYKVLLLLQYFVENLVLS